MPPDQAWGARTRRRVERRVRRTVGRVLPRHGPVRTTGRQLLLGARTSLEIAREHHEPCLVYRSRAGYWVHRYRNGATVAPQPRVGPTVQQLNERARDYFLQEYVPQPGDVVVDVGAGVGAEMHLFSALIGRRGRLYAIEAHPRTYRWLEARCRVNRPRNVEPAHLAITGRRRDVVISDTKKPAANTVVGTLRGVRVAAQTLDEFVSERGITRIDFLKMNIEGAEREAIEGMTASIALTRNACICCHDFLADRPGGVEAMRTKRVVQEFLLHHGFEIVDRHPGDRRRWSRDYVYGRRRPAATPDAGARS